MKTTDADARNSTLPALSELANAWALARILMEHERASTSPVEQPYTEREILILFLVRDFEGVATAKTICRVFDMRPSQAGKILENLIKREVLKKSGTPVSKKSGRGVPLELGPKGMEELNGISMGIGRRFAYLYQDLTTEQRKQMYELTKRMRTAAKRQIEERIFLMPPDSQRDN